jgi:hypothetical protein
MPETKRDDRDLRRAAHNPAKQPNPAGGPRGQPQPHPLPATEHERHISANNRTTRGLRIFPTGGMPHKYAVYCFSRESRQSSFARPNSAPVPADLLDHLAGGLVAWIAPRTG